MNDSIKLCMLRTSIMGTFANIALTIKDNALKQKYCGKVNDLILALQQDIDALDEHLVEQKEGLDNQ